MYKYISIPKAHDRILIEELLDNIKLDDYYKYSSDLEFNWYSKRGDNNIELVIKNKNEIIGFISFRKCRNFKHLKVNLFINFNNNKKLIIGKAMLEIKKLLTVKGYEKLELSVVEGNPVEELYIKLGTKVGTWTNGTLLDNIPTNLNLYEIFLK